MIIRADVHDFRQAFENYGREEQFSHEALEELFSWYDEIGENWELDVIAICCDWSEYPSLEVAAKDYSNNINDINDMEEIRLYFLENTSVIEFDGGVLIAQF